MDRIGRYRIVKELGRGAMGVVYQATDPTIGRPVAIKTVRLRELDNAEQSSRLKERLFREARAAGVLSHPGIVTIYDMAEEDDIAYIAMQFVNGPTLDEVMERAKPMKPDEIFRILRQAAAALDFAHQKRIVHRDIKPANIMIDDDGTVKIADFGIAKAGASGNLTVSGTILGTPNYMSPEQVQGTAIDGRSDQFSLAVVAYEILTGERPFAGEHLGTVVYKIVAEQPVEPHRLNPSLNPEIAAVIKKGLAKQADRRYVSCTEFVNALETACAGAEGWHGLARGGSHSMPTSSGGKTGTPPAATPPKRTARKPAGRKTGQKEKSLFLPAVGAFSVVLGVLALIAWQTGALQFPENSPAQSQAQAKAGPGKTVPPDDFETPPPIPVEAKPEPKPELKPEPKPPSVAGEAPVPEKVKTNPIEPVVVATKRIVVATSRKPSPFGRTGVTATAPSLPVPVAAKIPAPLEDTRGMPQDIWVTSEPAGATATLDGRSDSACQTPCMLLGSPGVHTLSLALSRHQPEVRQVRIAGSRIDLPLVNMRQAGGTLMLSTVPNAANIFVNDKLLVELTPAQLSLPPGSYRIAVERNGQRKTQQVEIRNGATHYIRIPLGS